MKSLFLSLALFLLAGVLAAQQPCSSIRSHSFTAGIGSSHQLDTYLSPLNYSGYQVTLMRETLRMTRMAGNRISYQTLWQGDFSHSKPQSRSSAYFAGHVGFDALWHYNWLPLPGLHLMAGAAIGADAGILYNTKGGNNPAQGRAGMDVSASLMAVYRLKIRKSHLAFRYQANLPAIGVMFSPQYGQSYYEIYEGHLNSNIRLSHPGNAFSLWQQFTVDVPVGSSVTLRAGYLCDIRQSHVNSIKVHNCSHSFMIGFVKHFRNVGNKATDVNSIIL